MLGSGASIKGTVARSQRARHMPGALRARTRSC
jgi:hypothetical protein